VTVGDFDGGEIRSSDSISEGLIQNGIVELIARIKGLEAALGRLEIILSVHGTDDNQSIDESKRIQFKIKRDSSRDHLIPESQE